MIIYYVYIYTFSHACEKMYLQGLQSVVLQVAAGYMGRAAAAQPKPGQAPPAGMPVTTADSAEQDLPGDTQIIT